jgi:hypothetical protein
VVQEEGRERWCRRREGRGGGKGGVVQEEGRREGRDGAGGGKGEVVQEEGGEGVVQEEGGEGVVQEEGSE